VFVERIGPEAERDGLAPSQLQTDVESRLRQSGIKVAPSSSGFLCVYISTVKNENLSIYAYSLRIEFVQDSMLTRNRRISSMAATWSTGTVGMVDANQLSDVRSVVADYVDKFINAYLEQNPRVGPASTRRTQSSRSTSTPGHSRGAPRPNAPNRRPLGH